MKNNRLLLMTFLCGICSMYSSAQTLSINATETCMLKQATLVGSYSLGDTVVATWLWDLNNDGIYGDPQDDAIGKTAYYSFSTAGSVTVGLKVVFNSGSADSTTESVTVHPLPNVNFHVDNACEFQDAIYIDQSTITSGSITQWKWDFDNDGTVDDNSGSTVNYTVGAADTYVSKLTCVSDKGCETSATKTTEIFNLPNSSFSHSTACVDNTISFNNTSTIASGSISLNVWDLGDGSFAMSSGDTSHVYTVADSYTVRLITISNNLCRDTVEQTVWVNPTPNVSISISPIKNEDTTFIDGDKVTLTASGADSYSWVPSATGSSHTWSNGGNYSVTGTDANGCTATETVTLIFNSLSAVYVMNNILTPNEDGINDYLEVRDIEQYENCTITIFNRWNDEVFSSSDYNNDWDGTYEGSPLDAGTYYYIINCTNQDEVIGDINILR